MAITLTLVRKTPEIFGSPQELQGYILDLEVTAATDMPKEIFVWQSKVGFGDTDIDQFINIASPNDLEEVPPNVPGADEDNPFFRTSRLQFTFRSMVELEETWGYIKDDVQGLVDALKSVENLNTVEEVVFQ